MKKVAVRILKVPISNAYKPTLTFLVIRCDLSIEGIFDPRSEFGLFRVKDN